MYPDPYGQGQGMMGFGGMDQYGQFQQAPMGLMGQAPPMGMMGGMGMPQMQSQMPRGGGGRGPQQERRGGGGGAGREPGPGDLSFRVLVPMKMSGSLIGQGGSVISAIRGETKSFVLLAKELPGSTERVCTVFSPHTPPLSAAQTALNRVVGCIVDRENADPQSEATVRILINKQQTMTLGGVINDLCLSTGTSVSICPTMSLPVCANAETDDLVEVKGQLLKVLGAVEQLGVKLG